MSAEDIETELNDSDHYLGKYFFVPPRARWNQGWQEEVVSALLMMTPWLILF